MSALQVAMSARTGALAPSATPFLDQHGERIGMSRARAIPDEVVGAARLIRLAVPALAEVVVGSEGPLTLSLALPDRDRPGQTAELAGLVLAGLAVALGRPLDPRSSLVRAGHAGGALALEAAVRLAAEGAPNVIVGGVDSYFDAESLRWLDEGDRLHSSQADDGFIPGEGAAFAALGAADSRSLPQRPLARLIAVESAVEPTWGADLPNVGQALTGVVRRLLTAAGGEVRWVINDCSGEQHREREWYRAALRAEEMLQAPVRTDPSRLGGDLGAATGLLGLAVACTWWSAGCAPSSRCLVSLASDGAERGGFVVEEAP